MNANDTVGLLNKREWSVLKFVHENEPHSPNEISAEINKRFKGARGRILVDISTTWNVLKKLEAFGLVHYVGQKKVDIPAPRGETYKDFRGTYQRTNLGNEVVQRGQPQDRSFRSPEENSGG